MWIEIYICYGRGIRALSQPARAVWIEIFDTLYALTLSPSQPARAVWIEILIPSQNPSHKYVTACEGCVD